MTWDREAYERRRQQDERRRAVRQAPRPPFESAPRDGGRRACPMCGRVSPLKRGWWHPECATVWRFAAFPGDAIAELLANTGGRVCWRCGARDRRLELEHVRPLWSLDDHERLELKWWLPFNLQLLCRECHKAKTAREAADRYALQNPDGSLAKKRRAAEQQIPLELAS